MLSTRHQISIITSQNHNSLNGRAERTPPNVYPPRMSRAWSDFPVTARYASPPLCPSIHPSVRPSTHQVAAAGFVDDTSRKPSHSCCSTRGYLPCLLHVPSPPRAHIDPL
ncbi:hypothetical protein Pcinc_024640 [Petrolisthes cinctipes]|uniref:Uncharacterized protein n=1 Tax=Petrolisthes cinctipes TaxID=88211 RepID=A0AAE1FAW7_PETCI|nr:hypothetical protein Pcinc_024640 [Petrolisthes cinctipes]